jgi:hypothetical protein
MRQNDALRHNGADRMALFICEKASFGLKVRQNDAVSVGYSSLLIFNPNS